VGSLAFNIEKEKESYSRGRNRRSGGKKAKDTPAQKIQSFSSENWAENKKERDFSGGFSKTNQNCCSLLLLLLRGMYSSVQCWLFVFFKECMVVVKISSCKGFGLSGIN